jgi:hypothetical protein
MSFNHFYDADMAAYGITNSAPNNLAAYKTPSQSSQPHEHMQSQESTWAPKSNQCPNKKENDEHIKVFLFIMIIAFVVYTYVSMLLKVTTLTERVNALQSQPR